jgi:uncharacterized radical SAM superfamily Fe-S cluster-containing enzyme
MPREKSPVTPPGINPGTFRLVAQCLIHYTTPGPTMKYCPFKSLQESHKYEINWELKVFQDVML